MSPRSSKSNFIYTFVRWLIIVDYACLVILLSLAPPETFSGQSLLRIPFSDKVAHYFMYTIFALLIFWALYKVERRFFTLALVTLGCTVFFGVIMEFLQPFVMPGERFFSIGDIVANTAGAVSGVVISRGLARFAPLLYY